MECLDKGDNKHIEESINMLLEEEMKLYDIKDLIGVYKKPFEIEYDKQAIKSKKILQGIDYNTISTFEYFTYLEDLQNSQKKGGL